jgi:hypothetical protein
MDERWGVSIEFAMGSFATGSSQQQVRPCPLCPDGDQSLQRKEMSQWANRRHLQCDLDLAPRGLGGATTCSIGQRPEF